MDKKAKLLLAMSISAIVFSGCTTSNPNGGPYRVGQNATNPGIDGGIGAAGVTHTHNGVAHTHRLPEGGLKHSHNIGTGNTNQLCQPCGARRVTTTNTGGNCHVHDGRRHCHPLPSEGTNHRHNTGVGPGPSNNTTFVNTQPTVINPPPVVNTPPVNNTTYYDYTNTDTPKSANNNTNYYNPAPASKGAISHGHNGVYHSHLLPAAGVNHTHNGGTSFGGGTNSNSSGSAGFGGGASSGVGGSNYSGGFDAYSGSNSTYNSDSNYSSTVSSGSCDTASGNYYIVKAKDGVYRIGVNNGVKRNDIIRLNNLQMPDYVISPGQCLRLR